MGHSTVNQQRVNTEPLWIFLKFRIRKLHAKVGIQVKM